MDYEDGQVEERNGHDHQAKKSQQEETADHDNNYLENGSQVSLQIQIWVLTMNVLALKQSSCDPC